MRNSYKIILCCLVSVGITFFACTAAAQTDFWQQTNGPFGGTINALAINSSGHIFAGTENGGIFRSTDNGESWMAVNTGLTNINTHRVYSLVINNSSGHIFAGTANGVFRSTDSGNNWTPVNTGLTNNFVWSLAINSSGHIFAGSFGSGVFRSTDNGGSWVPVNTSLTSTDVRSLVINSSGHIFVGTAFVGTSSGGIFRSTDNGSSWTAVNTGLGAGVGVGALVINLSGHIFAGTSRGIFLSTNNGVSWTPINAGLTTGTYAEAFAINSMGHIFAGTNNGVFRSTNNGESWTAANTGLPNTLILVRSLAINSSGHIFAGTYFGSGLFRSTDNGGNWTAVHTGLTNTSVVALAINSSGHIFAGAQGTGLFRSTDNGASWAKVLSSGASSLVINSSGHIFAGTSDGIFRSTNNGDSWTNVMSRGASALAINSSGHIFAGSGGIIRSTDNGGSWIAVNNGLTDYNIYSLAINSSGHIFVGTAGGVFRSTDNGNSWMAVNTGLTNTRIFSFAFNSSGHIFAGSFRGGNLVGGIFRSTDNGDNWTAVNFGLTDLGVYALAINSSGHIFAGTLTYGVGGGVFRSTSNGGSWTAVNSGLTNLLVLSLAINGATGDIFVGTAGSGVFRNMGSPLAPIVTTDAATSITLTSARLNAVVNPNGLSSRVKFEYGTTTNYSDTVAATPSPITGMSSVSVRADIMNLSPNTTYNYRVVATNSAGTTYGVNQTFITALGNRDPIVVNAIPNQTLLVGGTSFTRDLNASPAVFSDPDLDLLTYTTSSSDTSKAKATQSGATLTVAPAAAGSATITVTANDGKGGSRSTTFDVTVIASRAPVINHAPPTFAALMGKDIVINAIIIHDIGIASVRLNYRRGGDPNFTPVAMSNNAILYQAAIPADAVTSRGVEYFIVGTDQRGLLSRMPSSGHFSIQVQARNESKAEPQPNGSAQTAYRIFSVPLDLDDKSPQAILEDDLGPYDDTKWRFSELRADQKYYEYSNTSAMTLGKAFWLLVKDPGKIIDTGVSLSSSSDKEFKIALHSGWNFVGNPFNFPIPVKNLSLKSGKSVALRAYNGSWNETNIAPVSNFLPFDGYAAFNELSSSDTLLVNPDLSAPAMTASKQVASQVEGSLWSIRILAQCQEAQDIDNVAAISAGAANNYDAWDHPEPPVIGEYVSVYFPHRDWQPPTPNYCNDTRPEFSHGEIWEFEVTTNIRDKVNLTFAGLEQVPEEFEIWLIDEALNISQNLREKRSYAVAGSNHPKRLKLVVGRQDFIAGKLAEIKLIPTNYELSQNFPNPFNPATTIRYGLPRAERVTLKVYSLLGEEVATLINDELKEASYHTAIWDGRSQNGRRAASGVYVYRLRAGSFVMTKKMALVQ